MDMEILPLIFRWMHIVAAIVLVGGTFFMRISVVSVFLQQENSEDWFAAMRMRWARAVMLSVMFLILSGFYNAYIKAIGFQLSGLYLTLLTLKIVLAFVVFYFAAVLSGRSSRAVSFRAQGAKWYNVTLAAMLSLVLIAGYLKMMPTVAKEKAEPATAMLAEFASKLL